MFEPDSRSLYFPLSAYKYIQVIQLGKDLLPLDIVKASIYTNKVIAPKYDYVPLPHNFIQKDSSDKKSYVKISFDEPYPIEKIDLLLSGLKYFKRHVAVYSSLDNSPILDTVISSFNGEYPTIKCSCKEKQLWLVIDNDDNKPLKIDLIDFFQFNRSLVTYLDSSKKYKLYFGDSTLELPNYDITSFKDSITKTIADVSVGNIDTVNYASYHPKLASNKNKWIVWLFIGIALVVLLGITFKMLKEIGGRKE